MGSAGVRGPETLLPQNEREDVRLEFRPRGGRYHPEGLPLQASSARLESNNQCINWEIQTQPVNVCH